MAVECNLIVTDFLDVTFDLNSATYYLHRKPDDELLLNTAAHRLVFYTDSK